MSWKREPTRHALASHGVRTAYSKVKQFHKDEKEAPPKELYEKANYSLLSCNTKDDVKERVEGLESVIKLYWWCSSTDNWNWFNFDKAFNQVRVELREVVFPWFKGYHESMVKKKNPNFELKEYLDNPDRETTNLLLDYCNYHDMSDDIIEALKMYYTVMNNDGDKLSLLQKINLFDKFIHYEHEYRHEYTGTNNFLNLNIPQLRQEFEEEYL